MKNNISQNITIETVANHCHVSHTKLKNVFMKFAGVGVITHFSNIKNSSLRFIEKSASDSDERRPLFYGNLEAVAHSHRKNRCIAKSVA